MSHNGRVPKNGLPSCKTGLPGCRQPRHGCLNQAYFGNSNGRASSDVNMHRALCPHSGTILTT